MLGDGVAVSPSSGEVYAPVDGTLSVLFPTGHAIGITSTTGAELLIHIGFNTVSLNGKYFTPMKKQGDTVKKGELILKFDKLKIEEEGFSTVTPVILSNSNNYSEIKKTEKEKIIPGETLLELERRQE